MAYFDDRYTKKPSEAKDALFPAVEQSVPTDPFVDGFARPYDIPVKKEPKVEQPRKKGKAWKIILSIFLVLTLVVGCCSATAILLNEYWTARYNSLNHSMHESLKVMQEKIDQIQVPQTQPQKPSQPEVTEGLTVDAIYEQNVDAVVAVNCIIQENYFSHTEASESNGSGFIISEDGYLVTNYHVIEGASTINIICHNGIKYVAEAVGYDRANDIALLKVDAAGLPTVKIGSSSELKVGDRVCAIGNSLGIFASSLTVGYVSGKDRIVTTEGTAINMIQTDTAINPGNSGGPLFNMQGEVVGITSVKYSGMSSSGVTIEGMGFAIPMDDVMGLLNDLREYGYIMVAYMGVTVRDVEASVQEYGIPAGVFVSDVEADSAAEKAGVRPKDVIVNLGGHEIENMTTLSLVLRKFKPGDTASMTVYRSGEMVNLTIIFDEKPTESATETIPEFPQEEFPEFEYEFDIDDFFSKLFPWFG